jgi:hypothetical protein
LKAYAPGQYDPSGAQAGKPADVDGDGGFFRAAGEERTKPDAFPDGYQDATLTWQYADDAWAIVRGLTTITYDFDRMLELARAVRPTERTPVRYPLSLANAPARMPLASVYTKNLPI